MANKYIFILISFYRNIVCKNVSCDVVLFLYWLSCFREFLVYQIPNVKPIENWSFLLENAVPYFKVHFTKQDRFSTGFMKAANLF